MVQMKKETYDAAMSTAKEAWNSKPGKDKVDLGMKYLNASPLHMAALQGDLDFVKTVLEEIPQLAEAIDSRNQTPLHLASAEGHIDIVKELVSANVDTCTYQDIRGRNPLHVAVMKGHLGVVKELLVNSANVADMCTSRDLGGRNPVHAAAMSGKVDLMKELLEACLLAAQGRVEQDQTILHLCVEHNQLEALELLLNYPKLQELVNAKDADGNTALHLAVAQATNVETPLDATTSEGHIKVIKTLVGVSVNMCASRDLDGRNPLHVAVMKGHLGVVKALVKSANAADMCMSRDLGGRNPLLAAAMNGKVDILVELLNACSLAAQERGEQDQTILHLTVKHNQLGALELLLGKPELQELVNTKDADGNTVLHLAVAQAINIGTPLDTSIYEGQIKVIKTLVGVSVNMCASRDLDGRNPLHIAVMKGHLDIVQELVKSANVADMCTSCDYGGRNPLHVAAINGKIDFMTELLKACPLAAQVRFDRDQTILHLCVEHNQLEALELLLRNPKLQQLGNAKDADGNTALHLAVSQATNVEIVEALCCGNIDMDARNMNGQTALNMLPESEPRSRGIFDLLFLNPIIRDPIRGIFHLLFLNPIRRRNTNTNLQPQVREEEERKERIERFMRVGGALRANQIRSADWVARKKDSLMVVAALIATGTFQIGMNPPDSLKRDSEFVSYNAIAFACSLFAILFIASDYSRKSWSLLSVQTATIALSGTFMALTYVTAVKSATTVKTSTPRDNKMIKSIGKSLYIYSFFVIFISTAGVFFAELHLRREERSKRRSMMRRNWPEHTRQDSPPQVAVSISNSAN